MTDTVIIQQPNSTFKLIAAVIVTAILCWVIFGRCGTGSPKPKIAGITDSVKSIIADKDKSLKKYEDSMKFKNEQIAYSNSVTEEAVIMSNQASDDASNMRDKLAITQKELAKYKQTKDTAGQLQSCYELEREVVHMYKEGVKADSACKFAIGSYKDLTARKDEALALQGREIALMKSSLDLLGNTLQLVPKAEKEPWVKGYLGVAVGYGTELINFGPELTFITRKGFLFGGGGKFGKDGTYGEVRVGKMITFKKH